MTLERMLLHGGQTRLPNRVPGDPRLRHSGSSTQAARSRGPPTAGRPREDTPAPHLIAPPQATGRIVRLNHGSPSAEGQWALRKTVYDRYPKLATPRPTWTHGPAYHATVPCGFARAAGSPDPSGEHSADGGAAQH